MIGFAFFQMLAFVLVIVIEKDLDNGESLVGGWWVFGRRQPCPGHRMDALDCNRGVILSSTYTLDLPSIVD